MERGIKSDLLKDLDRKIILLSGPRQVGKTTLSKTLFRPFDYFNYDSAEDRISLLKKTWDRSKPLVILDELHKMKKWKSWLKGVFDTEGIRPRLLVTGSARLDIVKKMGDSLAGRFFSYRLHPLDLKELKDHVKPQDGYDKLLRFSGFPEPFLDATDSFYNKWKKSHLDIILRQDLLDLAVPRDISAIETLITLMQQRVGSMVSYSSLARDLERDPKTIKRWLTILENLFIIFKLTPYHKNIARSLLKEPKFYFFDMARIAGDEGTKLENLVALALRKELDFLQDTKGIGGEMFFLRTKERREIDFYVKLESQKELLIEAKLSDDSASANFAFFSKFFPRAKKVQLVKNINREKTYPDGTEVRAALPWLANLDLS